MNDMTEINAATMIALRNQPEALQVITAQLRVKEMGPADHIRTKHEVKAWIETSGGAQEAEAILTRAAARRALQQTQNVAQEMTQRHQRGQRMSD